ncbi:MAG: class I SAM-dependent methyltransferase [Burkholderiaceae bacterium]|jgi:SAM-dependent methyltransferase|nr:class I SAM-dependent methyltransferase [Burkholderiaceae bacterium]MEB2320372.1 class I SAM-dependent methyltransferase [Pseudomonadota bacterium]
MSAVVVPESSFPAIAVAPTTEVVGVPLQAAGRRLCKFCHSTLSHTLVDLGMQPLSNALRRPEQADAMEPFYPLRALVCEKCLLVQAPDFEAAENIFSAEYPYFSSVTESWVEHARRFADASTARFGLGADSLVVEIASNDGYLLKWYKAKGIPVLGVEPTAGTAAAAEAIGIPVERRFFGRETAIALRECGFMADLMPANNVVAHVPDIVDFVSGFRELLKPGGVASFEFHHLLNLIGQNQFDTIYHEHYYYHSLGTFRRILERCGLVVFDVEELPTHGGSLRVYAQRADTGLQPITAAVQRVLDAERAAGLDRIETYAEFGERVAACKRRILAFLCRAKDEGRRICAIGAPAKGNTLLNYLGVGTDFIEFTIEHNPHKQGMLLPGTGIPVRSPADLVAARPDYVIVLPWNWVDEAMARMSVVREWGGRFVTLIPDVVVR